RISFEAQLSPATVLDLEMRTAGFAQSGVEVCWVTDRDAPWVTQVPSIRISSASSEAGPSMTLVDGHARFEPAWCRNTRRCDYYPVPCPGHGIWSVPTAPVSLAGFVSLVLEGRID